MGCSESKWEDAISLDRHAGNCEGDIFDDSDMVVESSGVVGRPEEKGNIAAFITDHTRLRFLCIRPLDVGIITKSRHIRILE